MRLLPLIASLAVLLPSSAFASTFTTTSPAGGTLPSGVSPVGGVVTDLVGINGVRVVAQASAGSEFIGNESTNISGTGFLLFAQQTGITPTILNALGGGLSAAAFRVTLYDGDTQAGDFDYNENYLYVGSGTGSVGTETTSSTGTNLGNLSVEATQLTDGMGNAIGANTVGFGNNLLDTGFFSASGTAGLAALYAQLTTASLTNGTLNFQIRDDTYGDQYYDFTQGIDSSLLNVGSGPTVTNVTPEPASLMLMATGLFSAMPLLRRKARQTT